MTILLTLVGVLVLLAGLHPAAAATKTYNVGWALFLPCSHPPSTCRHSQVPVYTTTNQHVVPALQYNFKEGVFGQQCFVQPVDFYSTNFYYKASVTLPISLAPGCSKNEIL
jgi:hypothetical protein